MSVERRHRPNISIGELMITNSLKRIGIGGTSQ